MSRILILACSATKVKSPRLIAAWLRYDGPAWRTMRANVPAPLAFQTFALSAEHGLIDAMQPIADYDRLMTAERARELVPGVADRLEELGRSYPGEILAFGGRHYRELIQRARELAEEAGDRSIPITYTRGGIGEQLGQLKAWLRKDGQ